MTDQHPLTDEIIEEIARFDPDADDMRAAADWQLEQVIEWLKDYMPEYVYHDYYGSHEEREVFKTLENLKLAMRPTTMNKDEALAVADAIRKLYFRRLLDETGNQELIDAFNQLENN